MCRVKRLGLLLALVLPAAALPQAATPGVAPATPAQQQNLPPGHSAPALPPGHSAGPPHNLPPGHSAVPPAQPKAPLPAGQAPGAAPAQAPAPQHNLPPGHAAPGQTPTPVTPPPPAQTTPAAAQAAPGAPARPAAPAASASGLNITGATLQEVIDILARQLHINYIMDPSIRGTVTINTYGELQINDLMPLLQTILRLNNAVAVQVGNIWHIVPSKNASRLPISPQVNAKDLPEDERMVLNLVALRYVSASDIAKVLQNFLGDGAQMMVLDTGNLLLIQDNSRNMRRTMELIALFDNETLANQRVRLFPVKNSQASLLVKDLENIFAAYALSEKSSAIKFLPIERISSLLVVSPNPNVFDEVKQWIEKLDQPITVGGVQNFVYKVQYGQADQLAGTLMNLYGYNTGMYGGYPAYGGYGGYGGGSYGGYGGYGGYGAAYPGAGGYGGIARPGMMGGGMMGGGGVIQLPPAALGGAGSAPAAPANPAPVTGTASAPAPSGGSTDRTGTYLGAQTAPGAPVTGIAGSLVRIVPDMVNNVIIVQATQQDWEIIHKTLEQLDVAPRQVLIDAQIYEVDLSGALSVGVNAFLQQQGAGTALSTRKLTGSINDPKNPGGLSLSVGSLVGNTRELIAFLNLSAARGQTKVISAPSVVATDNLPATINVGTSIPVLTSQGLAGGAQANGTSLFTNTVANQNTGVQLSVTARVNATGIVTMVINQTVSAPVPTTTSNIDSPSIQQRSVQTQVTVDDGTTVAIGGIMQENNIYQTERLPLLGRIPILGAAFGSTSISRQKTELIILLTPHVIYDGNQMKDMTEDLKNRLRGLEKMMRND